jgi:hypothetical protein
MVDLQIPLVFDISSGGAIFAQQTSTLDIFDSHLKFELYGDSSAGLIDELKKILYADAAEDISSGVLFYTSEATNIATTFGNIISDKILGNNSRLIQPYSTVSVSGELVEDFSLRYKTPGIPLPNYSVSETPEGRNDGPSPADNNGYDITGQGYYTGNITDGTGTTFGRTLIRLMSTHLMGHPFAQDFIANESDIMKDISNSSVSGQLQEKLLKNDPDMFSVRGIGDAGRVDISNATIYYDDPSDNERDKFLPIEKTHGIMNPILQSLYAGLIGTSPERFDVSHAIVSGLDVSSSDVSGGTDMDYGNFDPSRCIPRRLPFRNGDTISFYFRPRVKLGIDQFVSNPVREYGNNDISGVGWGNNNRGPKKITDMFYQPRHRWIAHQSAAKVHHSSATQENLVMGNGYDTYAGASGDVTPNVLMTGTDLHKDMNIDGTTLGTGDTTYFDGHVWRIKINL